MKNLSILFACCLFSAALFAQTAPVKYSRATIFLDGKNIRELARLGLEVDHGELRPGISVTSDFSAEELALVKTEGFRAAVLIEDVVDFYKKQNKDAPIAERGGACQPAVGTFVQPTNFKFGSMAGYLTLDECYAELDEMAAAYPDLITLKAPASGIKTIEGRDQFFVKISDNANVDEAEPEVLYTALHHAREPLGMQQLIFYMWYLLENYGKNADVTLLMDNLELYFLPVINPDGYVYNETTNPDGGGYWRKNRRENLDGTFGVDLNRNYGHEWGFDDFGSSGSTFSETYRGTAPFSEPETQGVKAFCEQHTFRLCLNYHTYGNLLIYPWGFLDGPTPDDATFLRIAELLTSENNYKAGYPSQTVGYTVNGTSDDWMYGEGTTKPPIFSLTPEVSNSGFWAPEFQIVDWCMSTMAMNLYAAKFALDVAVFTDQSPKYLPSSGSGALDFRVEPFGLAVVASTVSITKTSQNVASVSGGQTFSFDLADFGTGSFQYTLAPTVMKGDEVWFEVTTESGLYSKKDTLRKVFGTKTTPVFTNPANSLSEWATPSGNQGWKITTQTFHSAPSCITDSPGGNYGPNTALKGIFLKNPVDIPVDIMGAQLRFWAKWDIEKGYDYVTCSANSINLCGKYTVLGTGFQLSGEPLFDATQADWVEECMGLDDFIGMDVEIGFELSSNTAGEFDGFYFDDFVIEITQLDGSIRAISLGADGFEMRSQPNPAYETCLLSWEKFDHENGLNLLIFNQLGQLVERRELPGASVDQVEIPLARFDSGVYFWKIETDKGASAAQKLVVFK